MKAFRRSTNSFVDSKRLLQTALYYGLLSTVLLGAFWPFADLPGYYFTKTDTGGSLYSARIHSWEDLYRIVTHPIKSLSTGSLNFYRPVYSLSLSLNYALGGLNPFGYHLTNLLLHVAVAGLLFRVVYLFNDREVLSAALAGTVYALHPLLVDVVPAVAHRQEMLAALFLLAGLWSFLHYEYRTKKHTWLLATLLFFLLSVGAKEVGILFLPIVVTHLLLFNPDNASELTCRFGTALKRLIPYLLAGGLYAGWWCYVTGARAFLGGGQTMYRPILRSGWWRTAYEQLFELPAKSFPIYFRAVLYPFLRGPKGFRSWMYSERFFSWMPELFSRGVQGAWGYLILTVFFLSAVAATVVLAGRGRQWIRNSGSQTESTFDSPFYPFLDLHRQLIFFTVWLVLPAVFYSMTRTASFKHSYHGLLPLGALLGTVLVLIARSAVTALVKQRKEQGSRFLRWIRIGFILIMVSVCFFPLGRLIEVSPLVRAYPGWQHSQAIAGLYNRLLVRELSTLPASATVRLRGVPVWMGQTEELPRTGPEYRGMPHGRWFKMHLPDHDLRIKKLGFRGFFEPCPCPFWLETQQWGPRDFVIIMHVEPVLSGGPRRKQNQSKPPKYSRGSNENHEPRISSVSRDK